MPTRRSSTPPCPASGSEPSARSLNGTNEFMGCSHACSPTIPRVSCCCPRPQEGWIKPACPTSLPRHPPTLRPCAPSTTATSTARDRSRSSLVRSTSADRSLQRDLMRSRSIHVLASLFVAGQTWVLAGELDHRAGVNTEFDTVVAPLLVRRCLDCHSGQKPKGGLDLGSRRGALRGGESGPAIVPGKPEESLLWEYIEGGKMPPKTPLPDSERAVLKAWLTSGAHWGTDPIDPYGFTTDRRAGLDWWSLQPVASPRPPSVKDRSWLANPIDAFVLHQLEASRLLPTPRADRRTLIRRLAFDLIGLPPTPDEVAAFLADEAPGAYEKLVDRYLASPHYGVRWARRWLDLARYGESNGFEFDEFRPDAWRYRDWVVNALNRDMPYDEFTRLQLAGDVLVPGDPEAVEATGFLVAGAYDTTGQTQQSEAMRAVVRQDELEDVISTVGQTFLGLTIHCARCHDHKFDPVRQVEYYRLAAALGGVRHGVRDVTALDPEAVAARQRVAELEARIATIEAPARERILADRKTQPEQPPKPFAAWNFDRGFDERAGLLTGTLRGDATLSSEGLRLDGQTGYFATGPLPRDLKARTLEAWVRLDRLDQAGGAVISLQTLDGSVFDGIVFAEKEPRRWMSGSDSYRRTRPFRGAPEEQTDRWPVHVAIVYAADGTIKAYRDGRPYGSAYKAEGPSTYRAGRAQILLGLRHEPVGPDKLLSGTIVRARLYDRALDAAEVAASANSFADHVTPEEVERKLSPEVRSRYRHARTELAAARTNAGRIVRKGYSVSPRQPEPTHLLIRGNPAQRGAVVTAGGVAALSGEVADFGLPPSAPEGEQRKRLAGWITGRRNPLFARVIV